jgi:hypothetical protein
MEPLIEQLIERRSPTRNRIAVPAALQLDNATLGWFTTRDLGPDGTTLRGNVANLATDTIVTVSLALQKLNSIATRSFRALVVNQEAGCVGLRWLEEQPDLQELLPPDDCLAA